VLKYILDLISGLGTWSYGVIFVASVLECAAFLGLFIPGESVLLACGFLSQQGLLALDGVIAAGILGAILGDNIGYQLGSYLGPAWFLAIGSRFGFTKPRLEKAEVFFMRHGAKAVFLGRFVGYARALVPFVAGTSHMSRRSFLIYNATGAVIWATGVVVLGYILGASWRLAEKWLGWAGILLVSGAVIITGLLWLKRHYAPKGTG
jgi:membrane protein DedA with SNARE-associated domain